nr:DUF6884 domain-containing protein [Desulfovirgula thermocuniculi]
MLLVVVPCGSMKIWRLRPDAGPTPAASAHIGPLFKVNKEFAERFADRWVILSAKYGFIDPDFVIPGDYDVTFKKPSTGTISTTRLKEQVREKGLDEFSRVIAFGGKDYVSRVRAAFAGTGAKVEAPTEGLELQRLYLVEPRAGKESMLVKYAGHRLSYRGCAQYFEAFSTSPCRPGCTRPGWGGREPKTRYTLAFPQREKPCSRWLFAL